MPRPAASVSCDSIVVGAGQPPEYSQPLLLLMFAVVVAVCVAAGVTFESRSDAYTTADAPRFTVPATPPKCTASPAEGTKPVPLTTTLVPPASAPDEGATLVAAGAEVSGRTYSPSFAAATRRRVEVSARALI